MSFDHASVEPLSGILLFYVPTLVAANEYYNLLYYIPLDENVAGYVPNGERNMQPVLLESTEHSLYAGKLLSVVATVFTTNHAPSLVFTLYAGLFVRYDWISGKLFELSYHALRRALCEVRLDLR